MAHTRRPMDRRHLIPSSIPVGKGEWQRAVRRLRFDRTIGFWLGGVALGAAGCTLGACMPYRHPVAVAANVLWWGLFLGCLGGSLGALLGLGAERTPSPPPRGSDGAGEPPVGADIDRPARAAGPAGDPHYPAKEVGRAFP
jgi:hypothetical protein